MQSYSFGGATVTVSGELQEPNPAELALFNIVSLETAAHSASQRLYREAILAMMEKEAAALGMTPAQLAAKNKGYRELKAFDQQIAALRAQL